ncbi:MAG: sulfite exporter TauE/SafE family protein [Hyphomicrobiales bacterium]
MNDVSSEAKALTLTITGMHCSSCEHAIERRIRSLPGVVRVHASERSGIAEIHFRDELDIRAVKRAVEEEGYSLQATPPAEPARRPNTARDYAQIGAVFVALIGIVALVQHLGLVPKGLSVSENTGYGLAFLIGLVASVTSCMAVTGGLLIALAAKYTEANSKLTARLRLRPLLAFNAGRLVSYTVLGGVVGAVGSALMLSPEITSVLIVAASGVMVILGLQMLKLLPAFGQLPLIPKHISHRIHDFAEHNSGSGAFLLGALTFFLPCGFTQALQLYVLAQGSLVVGALTMLVFALGTLPALLSLSALSSFTRGNFQKHFLRFSGVAVILLGLLNIQYGFVLSESNLRPAADSNPQQVSQAPVLVTGYKKTVEMKIEGYNYIPNRFIVQQGVRIEWRIDARNAAGCGRILLSRSLDIQKFLSDTEINVITFTPKAPGQYSFNCGMGMMTPGSQFTVLPSAKG